MLFSHSTPHAHNSHAFVYDAIAAHYYASRLIVSRVRCSGSTSVAQMRSIFYSKIIQKDIDTSALSSYYRGSFWIKKLYRSQK